MRRRLLLLGLLLAPGPALAQGQRPARRRRRPAAPRPAPPPHPEVDPAPRAGLAPVPDRRYPSLEQATPPDTRLRPVVPTAPVPTRGSSFADRDTAPEAQRSAGGSGLRPEPGVSLTLPFGR